MNPPILLKKFTEFFHIYEVIALVLYCTCWSNMKAHSEHWTTEDHGNSHVFKSIEFCEEM